MWEVDAPPPEEALRQGDLLKAVLLPKLRLPLAVVHVPGVDINKSASVQAMGSVRDFLVVSQCCQIENKVTVAVAPIQSTRPLDDVLRESLDADEPPVEEEEGHFAFDMLRLLPLDGVVDEGVGRYTIADLGQIISLEGEVQQLQNYRQARMSPEGRRLVRIKLMYFFGRAEEEDVAYLNARGIPVGPTLTAG
jgi:hypothetical protein